MTAPGLVGPHTQLTPTGKRPGEYWEVLSGLPNGSPGKLVMSVERAIEQPANLTGWYRWAAPHQNVDWGNLRGFVAWAINTAFETLILRPDIATRVQIVQDPMNEYLNEGHDTATAQRWLDYATELCRQWQVLRTKYPHLRHIKLALLGAGVGNGNAKKDVGYAQLAEQYEFVIIDIHVYWPMANGVIMPDSGKHPDGREINEFKFFSGRPFAIDEEWVRMGYRVTWCFGEGGPIRDASPWYGNLQPDDGWKHPGVCNGNVELYWQGIERWVRKTVQTRAYREGRILGGLTLFTTGAPAGGDPDWKWFETDISTWRYLVPRLSALAAELPAPGTQPPPEPKPPVVTPPEPSPERYKVVVNLLPQDATVTEAQHVLAQTHAAKETVCYSADDAGRLVEGGRDDSFVRVWGVDRWGGGDIQTWLRERYGAASHAAALPRIEPVVTGKIINIVDRLPHHAEKRYKTRPVEAITHLVVHHTVGSGGPEAIAAYHVNTRDWPGIGYHYVITGGGAIYQTNYHETMSYHVGTENGYCVGIALVGDFREARPTASQLESLWWLTAQLHDTLPNVGPVVGHKDLPNQSTECPGSTTTAWMR